MLKIAICDDEEVFAQHLKQIVGRLLDEKLIQHEIHLC